MWTLDYIKGFERSLKKIVKSNRQETKNAIDNANSYLSALNEGLTPQEIVRGYLHHEPHGIKAFDQSGPGAHKKAVRLYGYPDESKKVLYLVRIGGKSGQDRDIEVCNNFVLQLLAERNQGTDAEEIDTAERQNDEQE